VLNVAFAAGIGRYAYLLVLVLAFIPIIQLVYGLGVLSSATYLGVRGREMAAASPIVHN